MSIAHVQVRAKGIATSCIFVLFLFFILFLVDFCLYIEEAINCRTFVPMLVWS